MATEESKKILENIKARDYAIKKISKFFGYKTIMDYIYKIVDNFVFVINVEYFKVIISCKPLILDEMFWEIFEMLEKAKYQPSSFHVKGIFTANTVTIDTFEIDSNISVENEIKFSEIFTKINFVIDNYHKNVFDLNSFQEYIKNYENQYLNDILIDIINKKYKIALDKINNCIKNRKDGHFSSNLKSIIEYAKEYCEKRI